MFTKVKMIAVCLTALAVSLCGISGAFGQAIPGGTLDPTTIPKYVTPLVIPPSMPTAAVQPEPTIDYYEIAVRQFQQQVLPAGLPLTTVWSYGNAADPKSGPGANATFNYPAYPIEAQVGRPVRVKWINDLTDPVTNNFLPHLLPVDPTLHWADPGNFMCNTVMGIDCVATPGDPCCQAYTGPVPIVTHLHGSHVGPESDGYPEAWWLPAAANIPAGYDPKGPQFGEITGAIPTPGAALFQYPNDQPATTLWFHDHSLGMTRLNVYAGPAGFYLLRGGLYDLPTGLPTGAYEIPIVIQDRSFNKNGSLFYPNNRAFFEGLLPNQLKINFAPMSDIAPIWNPEFFGNTMVVNGKTWPSLNVEPRRYRLRFLNGSDSRFLILKMVTNPLAARPAASALPFWQIGGDGGFLDKPVKLTQLLLGPAERADVIVDFTGLRSNTAIYLINEGPDSPFGGGAINVDFFPSDIQTTGQVMKFAVAMPLTGPDNSKKPNNLALPQIPALPASVFTRTLSLNEEESSQVCAAFDAKGNIRQLPIQQGPTFSTDCAAAGGFPFAPKAAKLGTLEAGMPMPMPWMMAITETPTAGQTETWEIYNFTADAHPIHLHQVQFEVVNRQALVIDPATLMPVMPAQLSGKARGPEAWETGPKDTAIMYPGEVTRVKALYDIPGLFVWHCHILSHEDNEMMRPICVDDPTTQGTDCP